MRIIKSKKSLGADADNASVSSDFAFKAEQLSAELDQLSNKQATVGSEVSQNDSDAPKKKPRKQKQAPANEYQRLFAKGIRLLSMREHSVREITTKLSVKCESMDTMYAVIDDLVEAKYLCDRRFTESFIRSKQNRGFGPSKINGDLKNKGISAVLIDEFLDQNSAIWMEIAKNQYQKKYADTPVTDYKTWAKRARFMQSRGFSMEHIQVTVPQLV